MKANSSPPTEKMKSTCRAEDSIESRLFEMTNVRRPEYWKFIRLVAPVSLAHLPKSQLTSQDARQAYCLKCEKIFNFSAGNSAYVRRHMERFHGKYIERCVRKRKASASALLSASSSTALVPHERPTTSRQSSSSRGSRSKSSSLPFTTPLLSSLISPESVNSCTANNVVMQFLVKSGLPLSAVQDSHFQRLVKRLVELRSVPCYEIPSVSVLEKQMETLQLSVYEQMRALIQTDECVPGVVTVEKFSSSLNGGENCRVLDEWFNIRFTYLTCNFERRNFLLKVVPKSCETSLDKTIVNELKNLNIDPCSITLVLSAPTLSTDDQRHRILSEPAFPDSVRMCCIAQFMESVISPLLGFQQTVSCEEQDCEEELLIDSVSEAKVYIGNTIRRFRALARHLAHDSCLTRHIAHRRGSNRQTTGLKGHQTAAGMVNFVHEDQKGAWSSTFVMLNEFLDLRNGIESFGSSTITGADKEMHLLPSKHHWFIVQGVLYLLTPFMNASNLMKNEVHASLPLTAPCFHKLAQDLKDRSVASGMKREYELTKSVLAIEHLETAHKFFYTETAAQFTSVCKEYLWTSALDPRCIKFHSFAPEVVENAKSILIKEAAQVRIKKDSRSTTKGRRKKRRKATDGSQGKAKNPYIVDIMGGWEDEDENENDNEIDNENESSTHAVANSGNSSNEEETLESENLESENSRLLKATAEVNLYFSAVTQRVLNPLVWWKCHASKYPRLAVLAQKWLSAVTTSTPSTKCFGYLVESSGKNGKEKNKQPFSSPWLREHFDASNRTQTYVFLHENLSTLLFENC